MQTIKRDAVRRSDLAVGTARTSTLGFVYATSATVLDGLATLGRVLPFAEQLERKAATFTDLESKLHRPGIEDYDELNVRQVSDALEGLDAWELTKVRRYEEQHKNRKTVLGAIERLSS